LNEHAKHGAASDYGMPIEKASADFYFDAINFYISTHSEFGMLIRQD
jgi:hypothetical protein